MIILLLLDFVSYQNLLITSKLFSADRIRQKTCWWRAVQLMDPNFWRSVKSTSGLHQVLANDTYDLCFMKIHGGP